MGPEARSLSKMSSKINHHIHEKMSLRVCLALNTVSVGLANVGIIEVSNDENRTTSL